jgi:hypothetical protein
VKRVTAHALDRATPAWLRAQPPPQPLQRATPASARAAHLAAEIARTEAATAEIFADIRSTVALLETDVLGCVR